LSCRSSQFFCDTVRPLPVFTRTFRRPPPILSRDPGLLMPFSQMAIGPHHLGENALAQAPVGHADALAGKASRISSRMAQPASTRSARSRPMQPLAARSS
jgi:hypothetical protein